MVYRVAANLAAGVVTFLIGVVAPALSVGYPPKLSAEQPAGAPHHRRLTPYEQGKAEAERDLREGQVLRKLTDRIGASMTGVFGEDVRLLRRCGAEYSDSEAREMNGASIERQMEFLEWVRGYNEVSGVEIKRRCGVMP